VKRKILLCCEAIKALYSRITAIVGGYFCGKNFLKGGKNDSI